MSAVPDLKGRDVSVCAGFPPREAHTEPGHAGDATDGRVSALPTVDSAQILRDLIGDEGSLADRAVALVNGPRQDSYGEPVHMHAQVAQVWAATFGWDVDNHKAALAMALVKIIREAHQADEENRLDLIGYIEIADRCVQ